MSEIKDREERFKNNDLWNHGGVALENAYQSTPRDTSIEAYEEWSKEEEYRKKFQQLSKINRLARPLVSYIAKYDLPDFNFLSMPEEIFNALKSMPNYQIKSNLEEFIRCKVALRRAIDQFAKWILQINEANRLEIYEVCITFEPHTGGSKNSWLHGSQMERFNKETTDQKNIVEEVEKYYDELIPAFKKELKTRENSEKVKEIISEANELVEERKQLIRKIRHANGKPIEKLSFENAKTFVENLEKKRLIQDSLYTLEKRFDMLATEEKFPQLIDDLSGNDLKNRKIIEDFYKKEIERRASKKA